MLTDFYGYFIEKIDSTPKNNGTFNQQFINLYPNKHTTGRFR